MKLLFFGLFLSGCFPMRVQVRGPHSGRYVHAFSGAPIRDAQVVVESWQVPTPAGYSHTESCCAARAKAQPAWLRVRQVFGKARAQQDRDRRELRRPVHIAAECGRQGVSGRKTPAIRR
jgi:hypothetical protein